MLIAESTSILPAWMYATLPLWPLAGAILVGLRLLNRKVQPVSASPYDADSHAHESHGHGAPAQAGHGQDAHGHAAPGNHGSHGGHDSQDGAHGPDDGYRPIGNAHWPVVLGAGVAAMLALLLFFDLGRSLTSSHGPAGGPSGAHFVAGDPAEGQAHDASSSAEAAQPHAKTLVVHAEASAAAAAAPPSIVYTAYNWISLGQPESAAGHWIGLTFYFDGLAGVMMFVVTFIGLLIVIYSIGYMRDHHFHPERGYERFFAFMGLFIFSMAMLVLAGNFVLLYLGWEAVGLCSYLLIGFYYQRPSAVAAAKKAFIVNRIGDFGFALGIFAIYYYVSMGGNPNIHLQPGEGPLDYTTVFKYAHLLADPAFPGWQMSQATLIGLLLFCGAVGKSAQLPLYVWLPDAMEGPSPVSALIHAATMVTAGVYMIARCGPIYTMSPTALEAVTIVGAAGALFAATMAMAQYDMKRIMAYSTMSQLAYMFVGVGVAAAPSGVFHLYTHAFFKALLFLTAGNVMHAMGNVIDLRQFSGLKRVLPTTYKLMGIGCLALAGFPLLAGFWSKDEIIHAAFYSEIGARMPWLGWLLLLTALMTAYYTFRMFFLCFNGPLRLPKEAGDHPHEMPAVMNRPLWVLASGAVIAGFVGIHFEGGGFLGFLSPHGFFHHYLEHSSIVTGGHHAGGAWLMYISALVAIVGIGLAYLRYGQAPQEDPDRQTFGTAWAIWHAKYYVDEIYDRLLVQPLRRLGQFFFATDNNFIDGLIWFVTLVPRGLGATLRVAQGGAIQGYALGMVFGLAALFVLWRYWETTG